MAKRNHRTADPEAPPEPTAPTGSIRTDNTGIDQNGDVWWNGPGGWVKVGSVPLSAPRAAHGAKDPGHR